MFMGVFPSTLFVNHQGQTGGRGLSPRLWGKVNGQSMTPDGQIPGFFAGDDFLNFGAIAPGIGGTTAGVSNGYGYYVDTATAAGTIQTVATESGGVLRFSVPNQDNHEAWLTSGGNTGVLGAISDTAGSDKLTIFEARVRFTQIATHGVFVGLAEEGCAAANTVADGSTLADKDLIGFSSLEAASNELDFVYRKNGQAVVTKIDAMKTIEAAVWYKIGFVYDPSAPPSKRIAVFLDNAEQSTYVTATNIAAATFPDGEELAFLAGLKTHATAAKSIDLDWWAFYQAG